MASYDQTKALMMLMKLLREGLPYKLSLKRSSSMWAVDAVTLDKLYNERC